MVHDVSKYGANATELSRVIQIKQETAWNILHKLRRTMVRAEREKLDPIVEEDETYLGAHEDGKAGREAEKKSLIVLAVEYIPGSKKKVASDFPQKIMRKALLS
ncbi:MAG: hypothetical protein LBG48_01585 [Rickettsiales bacterium]|nr:hypothetical protein [Rickettsiales bacterium]